MDSEGITGLGFTQLDEGGRVMMVWVWIGAAAGIIIVILNAKAGFQAGCPHCRATMKIGATVCSKCGRDVPRRAPR